MNLFDDIINKKAHQRAVDAFAAALDALGYPYELLDGSLDAEGVIEFYVSELTRGLREGFTPVIVAEDDKLFKNITLVRASGFSPVDAAEKLRASDHIKLLASVHDTLEAEFRSQFDSDAEAACEAEDFEFSSDACDIYPLDCFSGIFTPFTKRLRLTALIRLPTADPYEALFYLPPFGADAEFAPSPVQACAALKELYLRFGAVPAVIAADSVDLFFPERLNYDLALDAVYALSAFINIPHPPLSAALEARKELAERVCLKRVAVITRF